MTPMDELLLVILVAGLILVLPVATLVLVVRLRREQETRFDDMRRELFDLRKGMEQAKKKEQPAPAAKPEPEKQSEKKPEPARPIREPIFPPAPPAVFPPFNRRRRRKPSPPLPHHGSPRHLKRQPRKRSGASGTGSSSARNTSRPE
jgi:hypothetical protein